MSIKFKAWPKIQRGNPLDVVITEKMDGTNACVIIEDGGLVGVQSRKRLITPEDDNFGFASWAHANAADLETLGDGYHYGEWAGPGIQKNPHELPERKFFLFNTARWDNPSRPKCCEVVPILFYGQMDEYTLCDTMQKLRDAYDERGEGKPEGVIVYYKTLRTYSKHTFEYAGGKWNMGSSVGGSE